MIAATATANTAATDQTMAERINLEARATSNVRYHGGGGGRIDARFDSIEVAMSSLSGCRERKTQQEHARESFIHKWQ